MNISWVRLSILILPLIPFWMQIETSQARGHKSKIEQNNIKVPPLSDVAQRGKLAYEQFCANCHGKNIGGSDKGPTFISRLYHPGHHRDEAFITAARRGIIRHHWKFGDMKPVKDVTDDQIREIVIYVRRLQKENGVF